MSEQKSRNMMTLSTLRLAKRQTDIVNAPTPKEFIKSRQGKKGLSFEYVEVGYVIATLNQAFSPLGWDFEILHEEVLEAQVWVRGQLTIKDHRGNTVSKSQYGTKEIRDKTALGDTLKAASSDCLKKCASMFGIALDVYWKQLDSEEKINPEKPVAQASTGPKKMDAQESIFIDTMAMIEEQYDVQILREWKVRISTRKNMCTPEQTGRLIAAIDKKLSAKGR